MSTLKLIQLYQSPWSERVRWGLAFKGVSYEKEEYQIGAGEENLKKQTGQAQVPVLLADGKVIPDSTAILNWLEEHYPQPALMPAAEKDRAQVIMWEELMDWVLGPQGRILILGKFLRSDNEQMRQGGQFMGQKYQYSAYAEEHAKAAIGRILTVLKHALDGRQYLVGNSFTRADLTTASLLAVVNPPPDDIFVVAPPIRPMFTAEEALDPEFASVFTWRDQIYRQHRGGQVQP
ncbi:MAG: glutathione S-transferase family protein [Candidatus Binatia bacterium]